MVNSCNLSSLPLKTVGLGTNPFAYGAYACDVMDYTPTIYAQDFIEKLIQKCKKHGVDFLIPGRDDEAQIYAQNRQEFEKNGIEILAASEEIISLCRDKERMSVELNPVLNVFVRCFQKETVLEALEKGEVEFPLIAKPRSGFASKGVEIIRSEEDFHLITPSHILQELASPGVSDPNYDFYISEIGKNKNPQVSEISIQLVIGKDGELLGKMATYNKLSGGIPIEILPYDQPDIWEVVDRLLPEFLKRGLVGPLNIQGRLTDKGLKIFEMNPRFTGITGLRALMGFNEVEACIKNWLGLDYSKSTLNFSPFRFGIRQTADRVMGLHKSQEIDSLFLSVNKGSFHTKKKLLLTGASGYLGRQLLVDLISQNEYDVVVLGRGRSKHKQLFGSLDFQFVDFEDLGKGGFDLGLIDLVLHAAFARPFQGEKAIAESLALTNTLFSRLAAHHVPLIVNISSQSVYGPESGLEWTESSPVAPQSIYGQAKYATELLLQSLNEIYPHINTVSLRLGTLAGGQAGLHPVDLLSKMVLRAVDGNNIELKNGQVLVERLDVRDASKAILRILSRHPDRLQSVYNLGQGQTTTLEEVAKLIVQFSPSPIQIENKSEEFEARPILNIDRFSSDFNWNPDYAMKDTVESLFSFFQSSPYSSNPTVG